MPSFDNFGTADVLDAAEKFVGKMDEGQLGVELAQSERAMPSPVREALVESIFDAFRQRGESSEDVAEGAGTTIDAIASNGHGGMDALLKYARTNAGVLREATTLFIENHPSYMHHLSPALTEGIAKRLQTDG
ncbi:MAG: hypothetical protein JO165_01800 [Candidatus Eremiobacteraeota bacterium]|nr:hypothetical protein [Candidatus Eremiobacteraeota bacterium]